MESTEIKNILDSIITQIDINSQPVEKFVTDIKIRKEYQENCNDEVDYGIDINIDLVEEYNESIYLENNTGCDNGITQDSLIDIMSEFNSQIKEPPISLKNKFNKKWQEEEENTIALEDQILEEIIEKKEFGIGETIIVDTNKNYDSDSTIISCEEVRIIACIYVNKKNLKFLKKCLLSLEDTGFDRIYINIPKEFKKFLTPDIFSEYIVNFSRDEGYIYNIWNILKMETSPETIIVSLSAGMIYPNEMIKEIKKSFKRFPNCVNCVALMKLKSISFFEYMIINGNVGDLFEITYPICFRRYFFKNDFTTYLQYLYKNGCYGSDELILCNYLNKYKIPIRCINRKKLKMALLRDLTNTERIHTNSGLNFQIISKLAKNINILSNTRCLYLTHSHCIHECYQYLRRNSYNLAIRYN